MKRSLESLVTVLNGVVFAGLTWMQQFSTTQIILTQKYGEDIVEQLDEALVVKASQD